MDIGVLMLFQNHPNLAMADYGMYKHELGDCRYESMGNLRR